MDSRLSMSLRKDFETDVKEFQTIQNQTALWYFASFFHGFDLSIAARHYGKPE